MPGQLLPPPELESELPAGLTSQERIALWVDVLNASGEFLLAGLRHAVGPQGDVVQAYRCWDEEEMREHDRVLYHMLEELSRRERAAAGS